MITFKSLGRYGRFANGLAQIAGTIGIARKNNQSFAFPLFVNYDHAERFGSKEDIQVHKYFKNQLPLLTENWKFTDRFIHWGYHETILPQGNWNLSGHMQSEKYWAHCADEVRHYFVMNDEYFQNDFCAVHIRLGDYDGGYHPRLGMEYYNKAMAMFPPATKFMIFSDDLQTARTMFCEHPDIHFADKSDYIDDFKFMKSCKHFIIGNSSFSWWAAWLSGRGRVIAPARWFGEVAGLSSADIYCKGWEVI